jgi:hypothetical protein
MHQRVAAIRSELAEIEIEIERLLLSNEAVSMAYKERTGEVLQPGEWYTAKDAARADVILNLYPWSGT